MYFLIPKRVKYLWLLVTSYYFYMCWNPKYIVLIAFSTVATYLSGVLLDGISARQRAGALGKSPAVRRRRLVVAGCFLVNLLILAFFKYWAFLLNNVNAVLLMFSLARYNRRQTPDQFLAGWRLPLRWLALYAMLFGIIIFGKYGPRYDRQAFIYFQF